MLSICLIFSQTDQKFLKGTCPHAWWHPYIYSILSLKGTLKGPRKSVLVLLDGRPTYPGSDLTRVYCTWCILYLYSQMEQLRTCPQYYSDTTPTQLSKPLPHFSLLPTNLKSLGSSVPHRSLRRVVLLRSSWNSSKENGTSSRANLWYHVWLILGSSCSNYVCSNLTEGSPYIVG